MKNKIKKEERKKRFWTGRVLLAFVAAVSILCKKEKKD